LSSSEVAEPLSDSGPASSVAEAPLVLRTSGLSLSFGRVRAVDNLNLTVRAGEVYGFLGRNGAGKTTTIRMLMGIIKADRGSMELFGEATRRTTIAQKRRIGYVSQGQFFYPWMTCRRLGRFVGGFYPTWDHAEFERLLRVLDVPHDRKVSALSGGMRVKLALALALSHRPEMLILDEPTAGLDPVARREFLEMVHRQARLHRRTTFFSSHLVDEIERVADRVGIIHRGQLCYEGRVDTLCDSVRRVRVEPVRAEPILLHTAEPLAPAQATLLAPVHSNQPVSVTQPDTSATPAPETVCSSSEPTTPGTALQLPHQAPGASCASGCLTRQELTDLLARGSFQLVREQTVDGQAVAILSAAPQAWADEPLAPGAVTRMSLEDIFIAMASESIAEL
jgi:ABC-2 type transport system ATP-binding protein